MNAFVLCVHNIVALFRAKGSSKCALCSRQTCRFFTPSLSHTLLGESLLITYAKTTQKTLLAVYRFAFCTCVRGRGSFNEREIRMLLPDRISSTPLNEAEELFFEMLNQDL
jgi:hypothetical protein